MAKNIGREALILKKRRKELGLTQSDVADAIGVQLQQYQMFEYGTRKISTSSMIHKIAAVNDNGEAPRKIRVAPY